MNRVGDNIQSTVAAWSFDSKDVTDRFDDHVSKSVPLYKEGHDLILRMLPHFFSRTTRIVDVGCSTGKLLERIEQQFEGFDLILRGIDSSSAMIESALNRNLKKVEFVACDFMDDNVQDINIFVLYYTLQFIHPSVRQLVVNKLYERLNWGGALFLFEKTRGSDARFQDIITNAYFKFKQDMGYSPEEIYGKYMSLQGVLEPFSSKGNHGLLERAGFVDIEVIFKYAPFEGILAIK